MIAEIIRSILGWVLLGLAPGAMLVIAVQRSLVRRPWELLCWSAPLSAVLVHLPAQLATVVGVPIWPWVPLVVLGAPAALLSATALLQSGLPLRSQAGSVQLIGERQPVPHPAGDPNDGSGTDDRTDATRAIGLLVIAILLGGAVWLVGLGGVGLLEPPNSDAQQHGFMVGRVIDTQSVEPATTLVSAPVDGQRVVDFYPLAFHGQVAMAAELTGAPVGVLLLWWTILSATVLLPCAIFVLARVLVPDRPAVAGIAAVLTPLAGAFPAQPFEYGGLTTIVGMALGVAAMGVILGAVTTRSGSAPQRSALISWDRKGWACAAGGVAAAGAVMVHTSQAAFLAVVLGVMAAVRVLGAVRGGGARRELGSWVLVALGVTGCLVWSLPAMLAGSAERNDQGWVRDLSVVDAVRTGLAFDPLGNLPWLGGVLAISGLIVAARRRRLGAFAAAGAVLLVLYLSLMTGDGALAGLQGATRPWYGIWFRVGHTLVPFVVVLSALAIDALASRTAIWAAGQSAGRSRVTATRLTVGSLVVLALVLVRTPVERIRITVADNLLVGTGEAALFDRLAARPDLGVQVLNQRKDGTTWMYVMAGVSPFWGLEVADGSGSLDRGYLLEHIQDVATDRRVQELIRRWGIRYVLVGDRIYLDDEPELRVGDLRSADGLTEVDRGGHMRLFRIEADA